MTATLMNDAMHECETLVSEPACPLCGGVPVQLFAKQGHGIACCDDCGHRFAQIAVSDDHVDSVYGDDYFLGGGDGYSDYLSESRLLRSHGRYYGELLKRFAPAGELLDVGAAAGFILQGLRDTGWHGEGLEPNDRMAAFAREQSGLTVHTGSLESFETSRRFDAVSMIQVVAHFVDPREAFARVANLLVPGGVCVIETWNVASWTARLFGTSWHEYSPPSVLHWFTPDRLADLLAEFGLHQVARGRPSKWINAGHAASLLQHKLSHNRWTRWLASPLNLLPSHLALPYFGDDLFWSVYRKSQ